MHLVMCFVTLESLHPKHVLDTSLILSPTNLLLCFYSFSLDFSYKSLVAQPILTHITFYTSFLTWRMCVRKIIIASLIHISSLIFCFLYFMIFFVCFPFLWPWNISLMHLFLDNSISSCNLLYKLDLILARQETLLGMAWYVVAWKMKSFEFLIHFAFP